jgi:hypothetical protein
VHTARPRSVKHDHPLHIMNIDVSAACRLVLYVVFVSGFCTKWLFKTAKNKHQIDFAQVLKIGLKNHSLIGKVMRLSNARRGIHN